MTYDVAIVGGGASGMSAAIMCARYGLHTLVLENNDRVLKKVLATGNGKCNFSNSDISVARYNTPFVASALDAFTYEDAVGFFHSLGMLTVNDDGRAYPYSRQASTVLFALLNGANDPLIDIKVGERVTRIDKGFVLVRGKEKYSAKTVILASGSNATTGTMSHSLLKTFGHKYSICTPSLTYLTCDKESVAGLGGIRVKASATIEVEGKSVTRSGELLFKNNAISGIMVFELSSYFARHTVTSDIVSIDLAPDTAKSELLSFVKGMKGDTLTRLLGILPKQLAILVNKCAGGDLMKAIDLVKRYDIKVNGLGDIKNAQVVSGGLDTTDFDADTMQSKLVPNLYAIGEVLDVDGECGGYNLHWAWASAHAAAKSIGEKYGKTR